MMQARTRDQNSGDYSETLSPPLNLQSDLKIQAEEEGIEERQRERAVDS